MPAHRCADQLTGARNNAGALANADASTDASSNACASDDTNANAYNNNAGVRQRQYQRPRQTYLHAP